MAGYKHLSYFIKLLQFRNITYDVENCFPLGICCLLCPLEEKCILQTCYFRQCYVKFGACLLTEQSVVLPVFGLGLKEHLENSGREIAVVLEDCIMTLCSPEYNGLREEVSIGLYFL